MSHIHKKIGRYPPRTPKHWGQISKNNQTFNHEPDADWVPELEQEKGVFYCPLCRWNSCEWWRTGLPQNIVSSCDFQRDTLMLGFKMWFLFVNLCHYQIILNTIIICDLVLRMNNGTLRHGCGPTPQWNVMKELSLNYL